MKFKKNNVINLRPGQLDNDDRIRTNREKKDKEKGKKSKDKKAPIGIDEAQDIAEAAGVGEFTKEHKKLKKLIKKTDFNPDQVSISLSRTLLAMTVEMLPATEAYFHSSKGKGIYGIVALSNQLRELANDLRAISNKVNLTDRIIADVVEANLTVAAQGIASEFNTLSRTIHEHCDRKSTKIIMGQLERRRETAINKLLDTRTNMRNTLVKIIEE